MFVNEVLLANAQSLPHNAHITRERFAIEKEVLPVSECKTDEIQKLIFAPDPRTGIPRNDIALLLNNQTAPEVAAYIREKLCSPVPESVGVSSSDEALEFAKDYSETVADYAARLRSLCKPKNDSK